MMLNDLSDAVLSCSTTAKVIRHLPTALSKGRKLEKSKKFEFEIQASITPISARELFRTPEGQRRDGKVKIISNTQLQTARVNECRQADVVCQNDKRYEIDLVKDWFDIGGFFEMEGTQLDR